MDNLAARIDRSIYTGFRISRHRKPNDNDLNYWRGVYNYCYIKDGEAGFSYAYQRVLGMGANSDGKHPEDVSPYGPYGLDTSSVPPAPYPEELETEEPPTEPPIPDPVEPQELKAALMDFCSNVKKVIDDFMGALK